MKSKAITVTMTLFLLFSAALGWAEVGLVVKAQNTHGSIKKGFVSSFRVPPMAVGRKVQLPMFVFIKVLDADISELRHLTSEQVLTCFVVTEDLTKFRIEVDQRTVDPLKPIDWQKFLESVLDVHSSTSIANGVEFDKGKTTKEIIEIELRDKLVQQYRARRYSIAESIVDAAIAAKGVLELNKKDLVIEDYLH